MIDVSELRIGNILHPDGKDNTLVATVRALDENKIGFYECAAVTVQQATAVSLSELWLNGYSFSYSHKDGCWTKGAMVLIKSEDGFSFKLGSSVILLQYVHQLQNLYFALFNANLEVLLDQDALQEEIQLAADSIMVNYLPKNKDESAFSFKLSVEGLDYQVFYKKDQGGYWIFSSYVCTSL